MKQHYEYTPRYLRCRSSASQSKVPATQDSNSTRLHRAIRATLAAFAGIGASLTASPVDAATIDVTPGAVDNTINNNCSLVEAIFAANTDGPVDACAAGSGADTVILGDPHTASVFTFLGSSDSEEACALPEITSDIAIIGNNAIIERGYIDGTPAFRLICTLGTGKLALKDLTLRNGSATNGGAVLNTGGNVEITNCTISDHYAGIYGGAIFNVGGATMTITNSTISDNYSFYSGGGIVNTAGSILFINKSTVTANDAFNYSGGIFNSDHAILNIDNSRISENHAWMLGGGIHNVDYATANLSNTTISGNNVSKFAIDSGIGGGIANLLNGALFMVNSTVSGNFANAGGGIFTYGYATITNSTISGNTAYIVGGGITNSLWGTLYLVHDTITTNNAPSESGGGVSSVGHVTTHTHIQASIVAGNGSSDVGIDYADIDSAISIISHGDNLIGNGNAIVAFSEVGDHIGVTDAGLYPLAYNGGHTPTHALQVTSPAIDAVTADCIVNTDQRGIRRPVDGNEDTEAVCDIGSVEFLPLGFDHIFSSDFE